MFTPIDKNLLIAAMESAIYHACVNANVVSLQAIETGVSSLRQRFDQDANSVNDAEIFSMVNTIERAKIPAISQISELDNETNIADRVVSFLWKNILEKPSVYPTDWGLLANKPTTFPPATHTHTDLIADWDTLANKPTTFPPATHTHTDLAADWNTLANKPATFPAEDHQHTRQRLCLSVGFDGAFSSGMERSIVLPLTLMSAQLLLISFALGNTGSANYTSFGLDAWVYDDTAGTEIWKSCIVNPADPPIAIMSGGNPKDFIGVPDKVSMGKMTLPKAEWNGNDWLRLTILQAATGAADASLTLEFDATFEAFESE